MNIMVRVLQVNYNRPGQVLYRTWTHNEHETSAHALVICIYSLWLYYTLISVSLCHYEERVPVSLHTQS